MAIRAAKPSDREGIKVLLGGREAAIDDPQTHIHVLEEGGDVKGISAWWQTNEDRVDMLINTDLTVDRNTFYRLAQASCEDALANGYTKAMFLIRERALLRAIETDFKVEVESAGNDQKGNVTRWHVLVDLADARQQLLTRLGRSIT
jgi:hypothetical protein